MTILGMLLPPPSGTVSHDETLAYAALNVIILALGIAIGVAWEYWRSRP